MRVISQRLIRAAGAIADDSEIAVIGSQAIPSPFPKCANGAARFRRGGCVGAQEGPLNLGP